MRIHKLILIIALVALSACDKESKTGPSQTGRVVAVVAPGSLRTRLESTGAWFMESQQSKLTLEWFDEDKENITGSPGRSQGTPTNR
jgi:hypothetical protein